MSAMLMTESWATEVSPWPQCVKVVPQDKNILSVSFFAIPECLASIRAVDLAFTANKQTLSII